MRRILMVALLMLATVVARAQHITQNFNNVPLVDALRSINNQQHRWRVNFVYNDLEDFRVTANIQNLPVPDAVRRLIGFYPISITVADSMLYVECMSKTDRRYKGRLMDEKGEPMAFANVALLSPTDSSVVAGGVTNASGLFVVPCTEEKVVARFSFVGYRTRFKLLTQPNVGTVQMMPDRYNVGTVTVEALRRTDHVDHVTYTFSQRQLAEARHSQDLLATLPGIYIDELSGKLKALSGKTLKVLINGIVATDNDLKMVNGKDIRNVDYYIVPPARYADVEMLVDIHTRKIENGWAVGVDEIQSLNQAFNDANVYGKWNVGNSQLSVAYSLSYRNNGGCTETNVYRFNDAPDKGTFSYAGDYHFGYAKQDLDLKYLYSLNDSLNFQVSFTPQLFRRFWRTNYDISQESDVMTTHGTGRNEKLHYYTAPTVDIYFQKKWPHQQDLTLDVVGSYFNNHQNNTNKEWDDAQKGLLDDRMKQHNHKYSVIGEVAYNKEWDKMKLAAGYKVTLAKSDFTMSNVLSDFKDYNYTATNNNHYAYGELTGKWAKWEYRLSIGGTYVHTSNEDTRYDRLYFTPQAMLSHPLGCGTLRFRLFSAPILPGIAQLSNNSQVIIPGLYQTGNPYLKTGNDNAFLLSWTWQSAYFDMILKSGYEHMSHSISDYYTWKEVDGERVVVSTPMNNDRSIIATNSVQGSIKPFKNDLLSLDFFLAGRYDNQRSPLLGTYTHWSMPIELRLSFRKNGWGGSMYWQKKVMTPDGSYLQSNERKLYATAYYQHKQLRISLIGGFLFNAPQYWYETLNHSVLYSYGSNTIHAQRNMLLLGVSYNLFKGRQNSVNKKIQNEDRDAGSF